MVKRGQKTVEVDFYIDGAGEHRFRMLVDGKNVYHSTEGYKQASALDKNFEKVVLQQWVPTETQIIDQIEKLNDGEEFASKITTGKSKAKIIFYKSKGKYRWTFKYSNGRIGGSSPKGYDDAQACFCNADLIVFNDWSVTKEES